MASDMKMIVVAAYVMERVTCGIDEVVWGKEIAGNIDDCVQVRDGLMRNDGVVVKRATYDIVKVVKENVSLVLCEMNEERLIFVMVD